MPTFSFSQLRLGGVRSWFCTWSGWIAVLASLLKSRPGESESTRVDGGRGFESTRERFPLSEKRWANYRSPSSVDRWASFISAALLQANAPPLILFVPLLPDKLKREGNASSWFAFTTPASRELALSLNPPGAGRRGRNDANNSPCLSRAIGLKRGRCERS